MGSPNRGLPRGTVVGRYVLLDLLGAGGMGVVYSAYDPELDRRIALKILHPHGTEGAEEARIRLLREAQAMARLSHPNVIAVHDAGTFRDEVFVAMEFIDGQTLTDWLAEKARPVGEVLPVLLQAGRGLQAAHEAGLIHRDFKPDNVLRGKDGRVCVCDFGLARATADGAPPPEAVLPRLKAMIDAGAGEEELSVSGVLSVSLTRAGMVMGTMEYMAPEQFYGRPLDGRTDEFSFCVALYEALYRQRPFAGDHYEELSGNVLAGTVRDPPRDAPVHVPAWLRRVLLRGLQVEPEARYPSMAALLAELGRDPAAARRRVLGAAGGVILLGALAAGYVQLRGQQARLCQGAEERLSGIWDKGRREQVERAFTATRMPFAPRAFTGAAQALSAYTQAWVGMYTDACQATRVRGEQSQEVLDLRMECLGDRLKEVEALTGLFVRADATVLEKAVQASDALTSLELCADPAALRAQVRPPRDPATRQRVEELRRSLTEAKALKHAGKFPDGIGLAQRASAAAAPLGYRPIEAEAEYMLGDLLGEAGDFAASEAHLLRAMWAAVASRHDKVAARTSARLVSIVGQHQARHAEGRIWGEHARADLQRIGGDSLLEAKLLNSLGVLAIAEGRYEEALTQLGKAVELRVRANHPDHPIVAESLANLGEAHLKLGQPDQALAALGRALSIWEKALGPEHPSVARSLDHLGEAYSALGQHDKAVAQLRRALAIRQQALGREHPTVAASLHHLGDALEAQGEYDEAMQRNQEALLLSRKLLGPEHPSVADCLASLGREHAHEHHLGEALAHHQEALRIQERALKADHPDVARTLLAIGQVHLAQHKRPQALAALERALPIAQKALGPGHPLVAAIRAALAEARPSGHKRR